MGFLGEESFTGAEHQEGLLDGAVLTVEKGLQALGACGITANRVLLVLFGVVLGATWYNQLTQAHAEPRPVERFLGGNDPLLVEYADGNTSKCGDENVFCDSDAEADLTSAPPEMGSSIAELTPSAISDTSPVADICPVPQDGMKHVQAVTPPVQGQNIAITSVCGKDLQKPIIAPRVNAPYTLQVSVWAMSGTGTAYLIAHVHDVAGNVVGGNVVCIHNDKNEQACTKAREQYGLGYSHTMALASSTKGREDTSSNTDLPSPKDPPLTYGSSRSQPPIDM